jgi:Mg2+/Co2+ transporter CorB
MIGVSPTHEKNQNLSSDELRVVVTEAGTMIPQRHKKLLTNILDLEKVTVNDIMIPRNEIVGVNLDDEWEDITKLLKNSRHTRLPVYRSDINNVIGLIHVRNMIGILSDSESNKTDLSNLVRSAYFVPENTPLNTQLLQFQHQERRIGLVVDEYGDVQGLVTLENILEEIVGQFTSDPANMVKDIHAQGDGTFLIDGSATIRDLNRMMHWNLPTDGPKTFNGLILEKMESIPKPGTSILIEGYPIEILQLKDNAVKVAKINPKRVVNNENEAG